MPQITGIVETALYVEDLEQSTTFYRSLFEFPVLVSTPRMTALAVPGHQVLLLFKKRSSLSGTPGGSHDGDGQLHMAFSIPAADFDAWDAKLQAQGAVVTERVKWERGGRSIYFRDPDGHLIELATSGIWAIY